MRINLSPKQQKVFNKSANTTQSTQSSTRHGNLLVVKKGKEDKIKAINNYVFEMAGGKPKNQIKTILGTTYTSDKVIKNGEKYTPVTITKTANGFIVEKYDVYKSYNKRDSDGDRTKRYTTYLKERITTSLKLKTSTKT
jgi:hypothetical protein